MINKNDEKPVADEAEESDESILEIARKRYQISVEAETLIREQALDDLKFRAGDQWDPQVKSARDQDRRPSLTVNKLPQYIRQVSNDQRQNRPSINVSPVDSKADVETAKVFKGLIRHIEYNSNADVAYDTAFESAVSCGFGFFRIVPEYCDPMSFEQELKIKRVRDRMTVRLDPASQEPDGSDANWGFVEETLSQDEFKIAYPDAELTTSVDWNAYSADDWVTDENVRVAEYFYKTHEQVEIALVQGPAGAEVVDAATLLSDEEMALGGFKVVNRRKAIKHSVKWIKTNGIEILEETEIPIPWIPIIPVIGDELIVDGKRILEGVIRHAKDPQRMLNYWKSAETETIALAPRAPFIGAEGQFEGHEGQWRQANTKNFAFLQYKPLDISGNPLPPPQRQVYEPPVQAITNASMMASEDMKATTGIYDASLGNRSNENSGIAIQRRNQQAQTNNFHFIDNMSRSLRHAGRILVAWIPHIYDTARTARIMNEDGTVDMVAINQIYEKQGEQKQHMLGVGKYDVTVETGPSYATKRQEAAQSMLEMSKANPQIMQVAGDLLVKSMDWHMSEEISKRLKKALPPGMAEPEEGEQKPIPPEIKAQMDQAMNMIDELTAQLNDANEKISTKSIELESRERIEMRKLEVQLEIEMARMGSLEAQVLLKTEVAELNARGKQLRNEEPYQHPQEFEMAPPPDQQMAPAEDQQLTGELSPGLPTGV